MGHDNEDLAIAAYNAYGSVTDHKNYQGQPMPAWSDLPEKIREAWRAAATRVRDDVLAEQREART